MGRLFRASRKPNQGTRLKKTILFLGALFLFASSLGAETLPPPPMDRLLEEGRSTLQIAALEKLRTALEPCAGAVNADFDCQIRLARTCYYLSFAYELQKQRDPGEKALEQGLKTALAAEKEKDDSAEIHSLLADIYNRKIVAYGDMFTGMDCGPKVGAENQKALALDPENAGVQASLGRQYLAAPPAFGGDVKKAVECFKKSLALNPQSDETLYWLARAYGKLKDPENREKALKNALQLNPKNVLVQNEIQFPSK